MYKCVFDRWQENKGYNLNDPIIDPRSGTIICLSKTLRPNGVVDLNLWIRINFQITMMTIQCRHLIPALNVWAARTVYTTARLIDT